MLRHFFCAYLGIPLVAAMLVAPAHAADTIATRVAMCGACHGQDGRPADPTVPVIWGQQENYLYKELHDFHSGQRNSAIMSPIVKGFSLDELRKVAAYFAAKPWPALKVNAANAAAPQASVMCKACHGQNFEGGAPAPRVAGLSYEYLIGAMNGFADGQRTNNLDMPGFMKTLTGSERQAIAHYLSAL